MKPDTPAGTETNGVKGTYLFFCFRGTHQFTKNAQELLFLGSNP